MKLKTKTKGKKFSETKIWYIEDKINKSLDKMTKKKKTQIINNRNENETLL
jgi:hypothetical protein